MSDYIRREDAINEICRRGCEAERNKKLVVSMCEAKQFAVDVLCDIPAADVVEVVRCNDCKYWNQECCARFGWLDGKSTEEDWYCPNGERRIEDGEKI